MIEPAAFIAFCLLFLATGVLIGMSIARRHTVRQRRRELCGHCLPTDTIAQRVAETHGGRRAC